MFAAINKRKGKGVLHGDHVATHGADHADVGEGTDLHGLVAGLSEQEKHTLKGILDTNSTGAQAIAKGDPSTQEKAKIAEQSGKENQLADLEEGQESGEMPEDQSDEIAKSMLDNRNKSGPMTDKPRNLGDRMKQYVSGKLKAKGKI